MIPSIKTAAIAVFHCIQQSQQSEQVFNKDRAEETCKNGQLASMPFVPARPQCP